VEDALVKSFPSKNIDVHLIAAKIHNSIFSEEISGKRVLVHRHTANIIVPDKFNLVSGYNNTNSFLVIGRKEAEKYLNSADHGSGSVIKRLLKNGTSSKKPDGGKTYIFTTKPPYEEVVDHITSEGIDYVIDKLKKEKIVTPAVRLTPLAVFKG
jgi:RNA-splicing ligase RtcB